MLKQIPFQYRITILYIFFGALWILFSDQIMMSIASDPHQIMYLSTYKGWFFVVVTGILLFFLVRNEIRRRTIIYDELMEAKKKAEESDRLKTNFLSNLSHYIRTPMNGILGFVELLEDKDVSEENHQVFLSYINEMSQNLLQTLNSIIEISKIQEEQAQVNIVQFDPNEMIAKVVETTRFIASAKKKPIKVILNSELPVSSFSIASDREKIDQIFTMLTDNATNFTDEGLIEIGSSIKNGYIIFWVKDTGRGIPKDKMEMLFTGFLNSTSATCTIGEGAGLGLPLSTGLVKLLGGKLWLESTSSQGSMFCFSIPLNYTK